LTQSLLCDQLDLLHSKHMDQQAEPLSTDAMGRALAALWVLGGGQSALGEGARVRVELAGQQRSGTIIRGVDSTDADLTDRDAAESDGAVHKIAASGLADDDGENALESRAAAIASLSCRSCAASVSHCAHLVTAIGDVDFVCSAV